MITIIQCIMKEVSSKNANYHFNLFLQERPRKKKNTSKYKYHKLDESYAVLSLTKSRCQINEETNSSPFVVVVSEY